MSNRWLWARCFNLVIMTLLGIMPLQMKAQTMEAGYEHGVSAAFCGSINGRAVVAGGCNFPHEPLASVSKKVFYSGIYTIDGSVPQLVGHLPHHVAYGVSAVVDGGVVMAGGSDSRDVWLVSLDADTAVVKPLPQLPCTVDNAGACAIFNKVYVAGGNHDGRPSNGLLCLDDSVWVELPPFPGNPRTQPVVAAAPNAEGEVCLWLFGGFAGVGQEATLDTGGLVYVPSRRCWHEVCAPVDRAGEPLCVAGGCAVTLPDGRIVVTGGVNKDIFLSALRQQPDDYLQHPPSWYRFNDHILVFSPKQQRWDILRRDTDAARAGAMLIPHSNGTLLLYGGEVKPRIRTPRVMLIDLIV